jgi:hypothetical protein
MSFTRRRSRPANWCHQLPRKWLLFRIPLGKGTIQFLACFAVYAPGLVYIPENTRDLFPALSRSPSNAALRKSKAQKTSQPAPFAHHAHKSRCRGSSKRESERTRRSPTFFPIEHQ